MRTHMLDKSIILDAKAFLVAQELAKAYVKAKIDDANIDPAEWIGDNIQPLLDMVEAEEEEGSDQFDKFECVHDTFWQEVENIKMMVNTL